MIKKVGAPVRYGFITALISILMIINGGKKTSGNNLSAAKPEVTTVSNSTADALKSNAVNTPVYSQERNKRIDDKVRSYATDSKDLRETNKNLDEAYKNLGTFGATAEMQQYIDQEALREVLKKFKNNYYDSDKEMLDAFGGKNDLPIIQDLTGFIDGGLTSRYIGIVDNAEKTELYKGKILSFEEVDKFYDSFFKKNFNDSEELKDYDTSIKNFKERHRNKNSAQALSDLIAFKVYTMDRIAYKKYFETFREIIDEITPDRKYEKFQKYFNEFLNNANPEKY